MSTWRSVYFLSIHHKITQAAFGGGGRGMRVVTRMEDVKEQFERAHSEAVKAFGNGSIFIERWEQRFFELICAINPI